MLEKSVIIIGSTREKRALEASKLLIESKDFYTVITARKAVSAVNEYEPCPLRVFLLKEIQRTAHIIEMLFEAHSKGLHLVITSAEPFATINSRMCVMPDCQIINLNKLNKAL